MSAPSKDGALPPAQTPRSRPEAGADTMNERASDLAGVTATARVAVPASRQHADDGEHSGDDAVTALVKRLQLRAHHGTLRDRAGPRQRVCALQCQVDAATHEHLRMVVAGQMLLE